MRIIWAIDAFEDNKELNHKLALFIETLYQRTHAEIEPVYLLRESEVILPSYEVPTWVTDHSKTAESLFKEILEDYHLPFLQKPRVIPHASQSNAGSAQVLVDYAERTKTDLIVVGSHGRKGFQRFMLGSFAESLILQSKVPVFTLSALCKKTDSMKHLLFPTDFGEHARESFRQVLNLAKLFQAKITLFHAMPHPVEGIFERSDIPMIYNYKGKIQTLEQITAAQKEQLTYQAELLEAWAQKVGIHANHLIDVSFKALDKAILEIISQEKIDGIIMESHSGAISAALMGSALREILRTATCPVYVLPKHFYDLKKEEPLLPAHP